MEINFVSTEKDFYAFNEHYMKTSKQGKKLLGFQRFVIPFIFFTVPFLLEKPGTSSFFSALFIFGITAFLWMAFYPRYFFRTMHRRIEKMLKESSSLFGDTTITFSDQCIKETQHGLSTEISWDLINELHITEDYYYLIFSGLKGCVLPTTVLSNDEKNTIIEFVKKHNKNILYL